MNSKIVGLLAGVMVIAALVGYGLAPKAAPAVAVVPEQQVGAIPGNEIQDPCIITGGVKTCTYRQQMKAATTTPCAFPVGLTGNATSTVVRASIWQDLASTSIVTIAKSATAYATTTLIDSTSVTANTQPAIVVVATSTSGVAATASNYTVGAGAGSQWVVFGIAAGITTLTGPTGVCEVVTQTLR